MRWESMEEAGLVPVGRSGLFQDAYTLGVRSGSLRTRGR
jgi:hypothetical protein